MKSDNVWTTKDIPDQTGKTAIVTGANIGIGYETALALYKAGAHVILACRNKTTADDAMLKMKQQNGNGTLETVLLDLSDLANIKAFAATFLQHHQQLNILINNAGVATPPQSKTTEGFELQFGTNFLGHYALTGYLYPLLKTTSGARVISLSSMAYLHGQIDFDNLRSEKSYDAFREYCQSKLATTIFAVELQRRITTASDNIFSLTAQPGANNTGLARYMSPEELAAAVERVGVLMEPWQGALPSLYAATSPAITAGGFYQPHKDGGYRGYPVAATLNANALDETVAKKLWKMAAETTGIYYPS